MKCSLMGTNGSTSAIDVGRANDSVFNETDRCLRDLCPPGIESMERLTYRFRSGRRPGGSYLALGQCQYIGAMDVV